MNRGYNGRPNYSSQPRTRGRHASPSRQMYSAYPNESFATRNAHAKGYRQFKTYDTSAIRPPKKRWPKIVLIIVIIAALLVGGVLLFKSCSEPGGSLAKGTEITFVIKSGETPSEVSKDLVKVGMIGDAEKFTERMIERKADTALVAGNYKLVGGMSYDEIIDTFLAGPVMGDNTVTVTEGAKLANIALAVATATNGAVSAESFTSQASDASKYAADFSFLSEAGTNSLEGYLFPKTYDIGDSPTADSIIRQMLTQYQKETATLDYSYPQSLGLSKYDTLILASIVEKEATTNTKGKVASVFYNRLAIDMALQSDATTAYEVGHDPTAEEVHTDTPYNTYVRTGLPPTPICSPSLAALQAVCSPESTNYLYFYFSEDSNGELQYYFSETYEEHLAAIG